VPTTYPHLRPLEGPPRQEKASNGWKTDAFSLFWGRREKTPLTYGKYRDQN
jgi:hypothetical protein